jgi:hypothetical protein
MLPLCGIVVLDETKIIRRAYSLNRRRRISGIEGGHYAGTRPTETRYVMLMVVLCLSVWQTDYETACF